MSAAVWCSCSSLRISTGIARSDLLSDKFTFWPEFTHQFWLEEKIHGYKGLQIDLFFTAGALFTYLNVRYDEKKDDADEVYVNRASSAAPLALLSGHVCHLGHGHVPLHRESKLVAKLQPGFTNSMEEFRKVPQRSIAVC